jgi:hypothetical protein
MNWSAKKYEYRFETEGAAAVSESERGLEQSTVDPHRLPLPVSNGANFPDLLERAGFHIRGRRADCPHCQCDGYGHGFGTVSFTLTVAYCHRCQWTGNVRSLSRDLGVAIAPETREQRERRERSVRFAAWRDSSQKVLLRRLGMLAKRAKLAKEVLTAFPDCEPAMIALADFYHNERSLLGALDLLAFEKLSPWLEQPMTRERLAAAFDEAETRIYIETVDAN